MKKVKLKISKLQIKALSNILYIYLNSFQSGYLKKNLEDYVRYDNLNKLFFQINQRAFYYKEKDNKLSLTSTQAWAILPALEVIQSGLYEIALCRIIIDEIQKTFA